jgi:hypothetical protein
MSLLPSICGRILWCPEFATLKPFCNCYFICLAIFENRIHGTNRSIQDFGKQEDLPWKKFFLTEECCGGCFSTSRKTWSCKKWFGVQHILGDGLRILQQKLPSL